MTEEDGTPRTADGYSERVFGAATFAAFDPRTLEHRTAAAALHDRLIAVGFGPGEAAPLFGLHHLGDVRIARTAYYDALVLPRDAAGSAARFFVLHLAEREARLRAWLGDEQVRFLADMAALVPVDGGWRSIVSVTWFADRLVFADARGYNVIWPADDPYPDYVMPPGSDSVGLERVAPRTRRRAALDLCCGAGAQTLAAAAYSDRVTGVDINPRALRFAHVNAAANRIENATFVLGDGYDRCGDARFDAIVANPPFVPWPEDEAALWFRDGGARGEDVLARILAGAVERLEPRGSLAICADLPDAALLPERIRAWQGETRRTLILLQQSHDLVEYAERHGGHISEGSRRVALILRLLRHYAESTMTSLDFGYVLQDGELGSTTVIRTAAPLTHAIDDDVADWFAHQQRLSRGGIADERVVLAPGLGLLMSVARGPDGTMARSCHVVPGAASVHATGDVSDVAFALLDRVATSELRPRDLRAEEEVHELAKLLERGLVRLRPASG